MDHHRLRRIPALDGLRGLAVTAVVLYHAGVSHFVGGQLGVTMFFTLSGFLITSLLLVEKARTGRVSLRSFWGRRARRLVPALLLCLLLVALVVKFSPQAPGSGLVGDAVSGALWVANWRFIFTQQSYADLLSMPSPFQHFWSLAVEEQYYLVFPILAAVLLARGGRRALAGVVGQLIVVSAALSVLLVAHAPTMTRAYYGTDTRMGEILIGALLALVVVREDGLRAVGARARWALDGAAVAALAVLAFLIVSLPYGDIRLFHGGLLLAALCTAVVIAAVVQPTSLVARVLSVRPLVGLGAISYGVYLFHWPLFLLITSETTRFSGVGLLAARLFATVILATLSYAMIETPVRRGWIRTGPALTTWASGAVAGVAAIALAAGVISLPSFEQTQVTAMPTGTLPGPATAAGGVVGATTAPGKLAHGQKVSSVPAASASATATAHRVTQHSTKAMAMQELVGKPGADYSVPPPVPQAPAGALRILVVGDSVGNNFGAALQRWASGRTDVAAYDLAIPGCPLSRGGQRRMDADHLFQIAGWCGWWADPSTPRYKAMQQFAPNIVFVEDGINETLERLLPSWQNWHKPGDTQFDQWLLSEYQAFINAFQQMGMKVAIGNAPCVDWQRALPLITNGPQRVAALDNFDYPRVVGANSVNLFNEVCPNGQYSDTVDGVQDARPDGLHFSKEAADALSRDWLGPLLLQMGSSGISGVPGT